ncbi:MAG: 4Fe-4S binding protein, partial [Phycisphaerae bacterium]
MSRNCTATTKSEGSNIGQGRDNGDSGEKVSLKVLKQGGRGKGLTPGGTKTARWRAIVLLSVNLLIVAHILHWAIFGRTLSPIEPSESMYFIERGEVNAGAIFFAVALLATLVFGRFVCGWACHIVALQDLCAWLLTKMRIRPQPFRSRFLYHAPFALAIYMFVWPAVYRYWMGIPSPELKNHIMTANFWETFPGPVMTVITLLICGFVIVYVLGQKAFCTYGCPYGGFFAPLDKFSPARIRVTDACEQCGHCTAVCTSNVRVHEEVATFGAVVDPGCMKCMDCVDICPNDALYYGIGAPALVTSAKSAPKAATYSFTLGEELFVLGVGLVSLFIYRGLYGAVPLLLTMGIAAILGFWAIKVLHLIKNSHLKLQNLQLKRSGKVTAAGWGFAVVSVIIGAFT